MKAVIATAILTAAALSGCAPKIKPPFDKGVCYSVALSGEGEKAAPRFNVLARDQPQIEYCAARLENMRVQFLRMGGSNREIIGSYQGQFIFIDRGGVSFARTLDGNRFFALARTGDGRLAVPGAIQRDVYPDIVAAPTAPAPAGT